MSPLISIPFLSRQSDARLVELARGGNDRAFETLVKRYRSSLLAYARRLLGTDGRAEDALQQALLQAWVALRADAEPLDLKPWLFRIVHNASVNVMRRSQHPCVELNEALDTPAGGGDGETRLAYKETLANVAALPDLQRRAIVLTAFRGDSHEQAAATLGVTGGAVRGLVHRARATLRQAAAAILPAPVAAWAAARGSRRGSFPDRIAELVAGSGSAGAGGILLKGGVIAATAGAIATAGHVALPVLFSTDSRGAGAEAVTRVARASQAAEPATRAPSRRGAAATVGGLSSAGAGRSVFTSSSRSAHGSGAAEDRGRRGSSHGGSPIRSGGLARGGHSDSGSGADGSGHGGSGSGSGSGSDGNGGSSSPRGADGGGRDRSHDGSGGGSGHDSSGGGSGTSDSGSTGSGTSGSGTSGSGSSGSGSSGSGSSGSGSSGSGGGGSGGDGFGADGSGDGASSSGDSSGATLALVSSTPSNSSNGDTVATAPLSSGSDGGSGGGSDGGSGGGSSGLDGGGSN